MCLVATWHVRVMFSCSFPPVISRALGKKERLKSASLAWSLGLQKMQFTTLTTHHHSWRSEVPIFFPAMSPHATLQRAVLVCDGSNALVTAEMFLFPSVWQGIPVRWNTSVFSAVMERIRGTRFPSAELHLNCYSFMLSPPFKT